MPKTAEICRKTPQLGISLLLFYLNFYNSSLFVITNSSFVFDVDDFSKSMTCLGPPKTDIMTFSKSIKLFCHLFIYLHVFHFFFFFFVCGILNLHVVYLYSSEI